MAFYGYALLCLPLISRWRLRCCSATRADPRMHEFNQSLKYDKRMYAADVKGSIAFSKALLKAGILVEEEQKEIERGLKVVETEWKEGKVSRGVVVF